MVAEIMDFQQVVWRYLIEMCLMVPELANVIEAVDVMESIVIQGHTK